MNWGTLTVGVVIIYAIYYSAQIAIELIKESKRKTGITEGQDYSFEEEQAVDVSDIDLIGEEHQGSLSRRTLDKHQEIKTVEDLDLSVHPIQGEPIDMEEIKRQTNIVSEAIFGGGTN